jgi:hypothetical protein
MISMKISKKDTTRLQKKNEDILSLVPSKYRPDIERLVDDYTADFVSVSIDLVLKHLQKKSAQAAAKQ